MFHVEKMKILHSAIDTTGIDWDDTLPKMLKVFMTQQPQAKYRHDYRAPEYLISDIDLTFDTDAAKPLLRPRARSPATRLRLMCHCARTAKI